jgi:hypothetical protein
MEWHQLQERSEPMTIKPHNAKAVDDASPQDIPARKMPLDEPVAWTELTRLGEEIGREWRSSQTGAQLLSEMRR